VESHVEGLTPNVVVGSLDVASVPPFGIEEIGTVGRWSPVWLGLVIVPE
jgi:hypothetical protein